MARLAIFASGTGTNFAAIVEKAASTSHTVCCLICNRRNAGVIEKAKKLSVPTVYVSYAGRSRERAEADIVRALESYRADIIALAGFMKIFTPSFVERYTGRILNIHPSLLPKYPGTHGIEEGYNSGDTELGITVHIVDTGVDTGPILCQESITRTGSETLEEIESAIHDLEHKVYPNVILEKLDMFDKQKSEVDR